MNSSEGEEEKKLPFTPAKVWVSRHVKEKVAVEKVEKTE